MSDFFDKEMMRSYWAGLSERDRLVLSVGIVVVALYLLYMLIYAPLTNAVETRRKIWLEKQETLAWMKRQQGSKPSTKQANGPLLSLFSSALKRASFAQFPYQLQQRGAEGIELSFDNVPYVDFLTWLRKLNRDNQMNIRDLSVIHTSVAGVVKVNLVVDKQEKSK